MSEEAAREPEARTEQKPAALELSSFEDVLRSLVGKLVTMANPESLEDTPMGFQLTTGFYRAKVLAVKNDYISVAVELVRKGKDAAKEPVRQFIPLGRVKRLSVAKSEVIIHI